MTPEEFSTMQQRLYEDLLAVCTGDNKCRADTHIEGCYSGGNADVSLLLAEVERLTGQNAGLAARLSAAAGRNIDLRLERDTLQDRIDKVRAHVELVTESADLPNGVYLLAGGVIQILDGEDGSDQS